MTEYIKLKDVEAAIDIALDRFDLPNDEAVRGRLHNQVGALPSADVVEVVRCKDCKKVETVNCPMYRAHFGYTDMDYCSCGEREDGEE